MRKIAIRIVLALLFWFALLFLSLPLNGPIGAQLADSFWVVIFTIAVLRLTGRAHVFVPVTVFIFTALYPFIILCWIGLPTERTWSASAYAVMSSIYNHMPLWGGELFIPTLVAAVMLWHLGRRPLTLRSSGTAQKRAAP
jgi:hypothetical protein